MAYLNEVALGLEIALLVVFVALVSATVFVDRRTARRTTQRPAPRIHRARPV